VKEKAHLNISDNLASPPSCSKTCWNVFHFFQTLFCVTAEKQYTVLKLRSCTFPPIHVLTWLDYFWFRKTEELLLYLSPSLPSSLVLWFIFPQSVFLSCVSLCWGSSKPATPSVLHHWDSLGFLVFGSLAWMSLCW